MENTINRKEYRREFERREDKPVKPRILETSQSEKGVLDTLINLMLLILSVLLLKFYRV